METNRNSQKKGNKGVQMRRKNEPKRKNKQVKNATKPAQQSKNTTEFLNLTLAQRKASGRLKKRLTLFSQ